MTMMVDRKPDLATALSEATYDFGGKQDLGMWRVYEIYEIKDEVLAFFPVNVLTKICFCFLIITG